MKGLRFGFALALLAAACHPEVTLGPGVKIRRDKLCNGYENCGVNNTLMNVDGGMPVLIGYDEAGDPRVNYYLGQRWRGTYTTPQLCGKPLDKSVVARSKLGAPYESSVAYGEQTKRTLKAGLKAALEAKIPQTDAEVKAQLEATIDRTVDETIKGTYKVVVQPYGLANDVENSQRDECKKVTGEPQLIASLAVLTVGGDTQTELKRHLVQTLAATADANAKVKTALVNANIDVKASQDSTINEVIKTAVANTALVVVFGLMNL